MVWANTFNKFDPTSPFGGYKESGYGREGGRHGLAGYLKGERPVSPRSTSARPTSSTSAGSSRARSPATPTSSTTPRAGSSPTPRWPRARTPATPCVAARAAFGGWSRQDGLQPRADPLPRRRDHGGPPAAVRRGACASPRASRRPRPARSLDLSIDRLVWYAGWADKITQVVGNANPVAGPFFNLSTPEPTGVVAVRRARSSPACSGWSRSSRRSSSPATPPWCCRRTSGRCRPSRSPRCWPPPTCPAAWSTSSPAGSPTPRRRWRRTWTSTPSTSPASPATPSRRRRSRRPRPRTSSASSAPPPPSPTGPSSPGIDRMTDVPGDQDRLAPDRRLTRHPCRPWTIAEPSSRSRSSQRLADRGEVVDRGLDGTTARRC